MTADAPDAAELAALVRGSSFLDEASREYWLDVLPALDAAQRQRLAELLTDAPDGDEAEDTPAGDSTLPDAAAGR